MNKTTLKLISLTIAIVVGLFGYYAWQKINQEHRPPDDQEHRSPDDQAGTPDNRAEMVQTYTTAANGRNSAALSRFHEELDRVVALHESHLESVAKEAADEAADWGSCSKLIYKLANDKVSDGNTAEDYLSEQINPFMEPALQSFMGEVSAALEKFNFELKKSTVRLAYDLAEVHEPRNGSRGAFPRPVIITNDDIDKALLHLGERAAWEIVLLPLDLAEINFIIKKVLPKLVKYLASITKKMFSKQIAKAVVAILAPFVDGPLPVGEAVSVLITAHTAYSIYRLAPEFEVAMTTALEKQLRISVSDVRSVALKQSSSLSDRFKVFIAGDLLAPFEELHDNVESLDG